MKSLKMECPHCAGHIDLKFDIEPIKPKKGSGTPPYDPGVEVDNFIIDCIDEKGWSLRTVADLLKEKGVLTAKGGRTWSAAGVKLQYEHALKRRQVQQPKIGE